MHPKPKSAPARMKSKFTSNKSNATKEMEAWAKRDTDTLGASHEALRMAGQLSDNVTEERMLRSKLWELSKERHKFLLQNAYEKKMFMDKIMKKATTVRHYSAQTGTMRRHSFETPNYSDSRSDVASSIISVKSAPHTRLHTNARFALLERMDPKNGRDRPKEVKNMTSAEKTRVVTFRPQLVTEIESRAGKGKPACFSRHQTFLPNEVTVQPTQAASRLARSIKAVATMSAVSQAFSSALKECDEDDSSSNSWTKKKNEKVLGAITGSTIRDPRYSHLEHALCPIKSNAAPMDLKSVVGNLESLHLPPRTPKEAKPKIELKAMEFMKERGIVF
ncbi:uncharacterized protein LOC121379126 [Gigantopelta aegis]|uniref:uncharacterized protein LOC121379126 n=1 Tax=Gigantopelta aegis TaxID=1735272 RepID=UPI001B88B158|nr:uncharacterized protein LOC121379126 [Gigantopelta aegis]